MSDSDHQTRINQLEILYSEQEYTIEALNSVVTKQAQDIEYLNIQLDLLKHQIKEMKKQLPQNNIIDEKPPHY